MKHLPFCLTQALVLPLLTGILCLCPACTKKTNEPRQVETPFYTGLPIVSYTIVASDQVSASGEVPEGAYATFSNSYHHKNQLTAGHEAKLTLRNIKDIKIRSITLTMRSNKASGAGRLSMTNDQQEVWTIPDAPFSSHLWHGVYSTDTVPVFHLFSRPVECGDEVEIIISATTNSLYIMRYDIEYEPAPQPSYVLTRDTSLVSGVKTITYLNIARLTGPIEDNAIQTQIDSFPLDANDYYEIQYFDDSTATIKHVATQTYIGCSNGMLAKIATRWKVETSTDWEGKGDTYFSFHIHENGRYYYPLPDPESLVCELRTDDKRHTQFWVLLSVQ